MAPSKKYPRLDALDHKSIDEVTYKSRLKDYQFQLVQLQRLLLETRRSMIVVVEGPDAAGKGGAIKRLVEKLDPRFLSVHGIAKPTAEEASRHYLWRFWTRLPEYGRIAIFDRSWYRRLLVDRVEGFATKT